MERASSLLMCGLLAIASIATAAHSPEQESHDTYSPEYVKCPADLRVRAASDGLSPAETAWRHLRAAHSICALEEYLTLVAIPDLDIPYYLSLLDATTAPVVGLSISGGGTQSGIGGLGVWEALDARSPRALRAGTGGVAQVLTYLTGLSGGGAVTVATIAAHDFGTLGEIRREVNFSVNYAEGPGGNETAYFEGIFEDVGSKAESGFPVSVVDVFGRFWANYLPRKWRYSDWSDLADAEQQHDGVGGGAFARGQAPMPIAVLAEVVPGVSPEIHGLTYPGFNATNQFNLTSYEVTPFEFGSWLGGRVQAFMPTRWLGTRMEDGRPQNTSKCVTGFDKFTFVQGATTNAFVAWFIDAWYGIPIFARRAMEQTRRIMIPPDQRKSPLVQLVAETAKTFQQTFNQSLWATTPNPFKNYNDRMSGVDELLLVDGSLTGETNPIRPLIIPERGVDFIIVYESSSDAKYDWVNGTNLINTARAAEEGNIPFPRVPNVNTMITRNFTRFPTYFGCFHEDPKHHPPPPLVLYLPNSPWSAYTNFSFEKPSFTPEQFDATVGNAFDIATYGALSGGREAATWSSAPEWSVCLACGVLQGSMRRLGMTMPQQCGRCFEAHCWDGEEEETSGPEAQSPTAEQVDPGLLLDPGLGYAEWRMKFWDN